MKRVLVIGDTILDIYCYGEVNRISPEAPVPVFDYKSEEHVLGGACNVAANIRTLLKDKDTSIDYFGYYSKEISDLLRKYKIGCVGVPVNDNLILKKQRFVCDKHQLLRVDNHKKYKDVNNWLKYKSVDLQHYDIIVISDYDKGTLKEAEFELLSYANNYKIIDLKRVRSPISFRDSDCILKCNEKEYESNKNITRLGANVVVTKGDKGYYFPLTDELFPNVRHTGEVIDVVGAGDVFLAGMAVNFLESGNFDMHEMAAFGNICAGEKVKHFGTIAVDRGVI